MNTTDDPRRTTAARRRVLAIAAVTGFSVAAAAYAWPRKPAPVPVAAVPVNAGHAITTDFPIRVSAVGTVQALNTVDMKVRVDGQLQRIAFAEGQDVKAGQLLAQLDQGPLTAQLHQAEAAQRKDQASLDNARIDLARYTKLAAIGAATSQALDTAKAQVTSLTATVAADAALVQSDRLQLGFTSLVAPFTGRVGAREADIGAIVHPGDATGIVTVTQMEPISVTFSVPQDALPALLASQAPAQNTAPLPVSVTSRSGATPLADGTLTFIDSAVDTATGQIKLKATFANRDRKLWPGELVTARVHVRTDTQRLALPSRAIVNTRGGAQVYVIAGDGKVRMQAVQTGVDIDGMTEIRGGITSADLVVFDGQSRLKPAVLVSATQVATRAEAPGGGPSAAQGQQNSLDNPS